MGTEQEMMISAPLMIPAAPTPAIARPTINMVEDTAAPQRADPSSKMRKKARNENLLLKCANTLPDRGCGAAL